MSDYSPEETAGAQKVLLDWIASGDIRTTETVLQGFDQVANAFLGLFTGANIGKMLVQV